MGLLGFGSRIVLGNMIMNSCACKREDAFDLFGNGAALTLTDSFVASLASLGSKPLRHDDVIDWGNYFRPSLRRIKKEL